MKKMKFRKLSRVLISISLLAIIAVSLISVPVSAAEGDSVVGIWVLKDTLTPVTTNIYQPGGLGVEGVYHWYDSQTDSVLDAPLGWFSVSGNSSVSINLNATYDGNGGTGGGSGYPQINIYSGSVTTWINTSTSKKLTASSSEITLEEYTLLRTIEFTADPDGTDAEAFKVWLVENADKVIPPSPTLLENILGTFSEVGSWIGTIISSLVALFWSVETASLTFLGILSVAGLAFSVIMLLFSFVTRFVGFSG